MTKISDSIEINTTANKIFEWFLHLDENYRSWHPDHVSCECIKGKPFEPGSIILVKEYLHGKLHEIKSRTTNIKKNELIEYVNLFPTSIISPKGSFIIRQKESGCVFTATLSFRSGFILSKIFKKQLQETKRHMREEGVNLKALLEKSR